MCPASRQGMPQQTLHVPGNSLRKKILPLKWIFNNTHSASSYSSKVLPHVINSTLLHFQLVKVSLGVPLQGLSLIIVLLLG